MRGRQLSITPKLSPLGHLGMFVEARSWKLPATDIGTG
jgi:pimeloyl-ACP methyl ester carboxylesterase